MEKKELSNHDETTTGTVQQKVTRMQSTANTAENDTFCDAKSATPIGVSPHEVASTAQNDHSDIGNVSDIPVAFHLGRRKHSDDQYDGNDSNDDDESYDIVHQSIPKRTKFSEETGVYGVSMSAEDEQYQRTLLEAPTPRDTALSATALEPITPRPRTDDSATTLLQTVQQASSNGSVSSEFSSTSANSAIASARGFIQSPIHTFIQEVPPAPPSTPASHPHSSIFSIDTSNMSCYLPNMPLTSSTTSTVVVENAAWLERQLLLAEGAATPAAPSRQTQTASSVASGAATATTANTTAVPATASQAAAATATTAAAAALPEDFSDWAVGDRYKLIRILGRGSYGEVAQALDLYAGRADAFVAIKRILSPFVQEVDAVRLYREIHILRRMRGHDCIMKLLDIVQPPTDDIDDFHDLYLVCEYVDTDLYKLILSPQYLTTEHIQTFMYQMLAGLKFVHSFSVIHRDLKPANILLNEDCSLKICDFGLARIVDTSAMSTKTKEGKVVKVGQVDQSTMFGNLLPKMGLTRQLTKHVVTRWYRAPELILLQPYTSAVDIWSLGCILAELLSMQEGNVAGYQDRQPLFPGGTCFPLSGDDDRTRKDERLDQLSVIFSVIGAPCKADMEAVGRANEYVASLGHKKGKHFEDLYPAADPAAVDLLKRMLHFNPKHRCTADEALEHVFFRGVRRKELEITADGPLEGPDFLENLHVDLRLVKEKTLEEVRYFHSQKSSASKITTSAHASPKGDH